MHKTKIKMVPEIFQGQFSFVNHNYQTRFSKHNFKIPNPSKTSKFSITLRGPKIFNSILENSEKTLNNLSKFKKLAKDRVINITNHGIFY